MDDLSLSELAGTIAGQLEHAGVPPGEARLDAELLLRHVLGWDRAWWLTRGHEPHPEVLPALIPLVARRVAREPMAYVLGSREFWGRSFDVSRDVLVPRPETEIIVERALARLEEGGAATVADVGTGTGCLAISLALERPRVQVVATDVSWSALQIARRNARRHDISARVALCRASLLECLPAAALDLVVSNPPYVPTTCRGLLPPEVRDHEPACALFAGPDGLDVIRPLLDDAARTLRPGGWLLFEIGQGQADAVSALIAQQRAWTGVELVADLQGIPRTVVVRRL